MNNKNERKCERKRPLLNNKTERKYLELLCITKTYMLVNISTKRKRIYISENNRFGGFKIMIKFQTVALGIFMSCTNCIPKN